MTRDAVAPGNSPVARSSTTRRLRNRARPGFRPDRPSRGVRRARPPGRRVRDRGTGCSAPAIACTSSTGTSRVHGKTVPAPPTLPGKSGKHSDLLGSDDMRMEWSDDELVASWTLVGEDWSLVGNKTGATRLGFAVLLKFFEIEARFPPAPDEVPPSPSGGGVLGRAAAGRCGRLCRLRVVGAHDRIPPGAGSCCVRVPRVRPSHVCHERSPSRWLYRDGGSRGVHELRRTGGA